MIIDRETQVSDLQAITATAYSTDTVDLGAVRSTYDISDAEHLMPWAQVGTGFALLTSLDVQVVQSDNANLSSHDVLATVNVPIANLTAGARINLPKAMPRVTKRYLGFRYAVNGTNPNAGTISAGFVMDRQTSKTDF